MWFVDPEARKQLWAAFRIAGGATEFGLSVVAGLGLGWWLDRKFETGPWLGLVGIGFGIAAGSRSLYRSAKRAKADMDKVDPTATSLDTDTPFDSNRSGYLEDAPNSDSADAADADAGDTKNDRPN